MLDRRFFESCQCTSHKGAHFESYKAVYARSTMVLFSRKTRTPLAALTLSTRDVGCLSMITGRPSPADTKEPYFQGMLNMPDQAFNFSISNLSERGMINFNILHTPHRVSCVDPGPSYGVNEVNELSPDESITVKADQRSNRQMVLAGKTKTIQDPVTQQEKQVAVTVQDTETSDKNQGLYFYLSVVPDKACKPLVDKFAEGTVWKVVPGFVRRMAQPPPLKPTGISRSFPSPQRPSLDPSFSFPGAAASPRPLGLSEARGSAIGPAVFYTQQQSRGIHNAPPTVHADVFYSSAPISPCFGNPQPMYAGYGATPSPAAPSTTGASWMTLRGSATNDVALEREPDEVGLSFNAQLFSRTSDATRDDDVVMEDVGNSSSVQRHAKPVDVGSTQAGKLTYGEHVDVASSYTGHDYAYERASEPTVLCMSIWEEMKFLPLTETIEKELEAEVKEWIENEGKALIESLNAVFKSETCVIDLESEADTIICTCGHQCINHANVRQLLEAQHHYDHKCPMCRGPITAFVKADGILVG